MLLMESEIVYTQDIKVDSMNYEKLVQDLELQSDKVHEYYPLNADTKRLRLNELTWEEKILRKKLRNRIAAQTSRDRKKAKMDHLEEAVKNLKQQNELLLAEVKELKKKNDTLLNANLELQKVLAQRSFTCSCLQKFKEDFEIQSPQKMEEQICVEDGYCFERPAESTEIPQQKGPLPTSAQVLADFKGDSFIIELEKLATSMLGEVEQHESRRDTEPVLKEVSEIGQKECSYNTQMVGKASEKLESTGNEIVALNQQQHCSSSTELTMKEKLWHISAEHSYASLENSHFTLIEFSKRNLNCPEFNVPTITISDSDKISAIENELKRGLEPHEITISQPHIDNSGAFLNICSPKSDVLSDQGYDSADSPHDVEMSLTDELNEFNELWGSSFLELFPELL